MKDKQKGVTLLELVMALFVFSIIIFSAVNMLNFVLNRTVLIQEAREQNFSANLAMNSLVVHINEATHFNLTTMNQSLYRLRLYGGHLQTGVERIFIFHRHSNILRFGGYNTRPVGQPLAYDIEDVVITINGNLMHILVVTDEISLNRVIDIRHMTEF